MEITNLLHTEQVIGTRRSFFIDLKKSVNGTNYLSITQSQKVDEENKEYTKIVLFENEIARFSEALMRSLLQFTLVQDAEIKKYKAAIKDQYPKAYSKWTPTDEERLKELFNQGHDVENLCDNLQRNSAGILARLKKLGLTVEETGQEK